MLKVLIVEDNIIFTQALKDMISWERLGFCIAGTASNGVQALKMIEGNLPDIVITDIKMPAMNGIDLIKVIKQRYKQIELVVLSSYDDFEFVKQALKSGATDYILKHDLCAEKVMEVLEQLKGKIVARPEISMAFSMLNNREILIKSFLSRLIDVNLSDRTEVDNTIKELMLDFMFKKYILYVLKPVKEAEEYKFYNTEALQAREQDLYDSVKNFISNLDNESQKGYICIDLKQGQVAVINSQKGVFSQSKLMNKASEFYRGISLIYGYGIQMGVSLSNAHISDIRQAYLQASEARFSFVYSSGAGIAYYQRTEDIDISKVKEGIACLSRIFSINREEDIFNMLSSIIESIIILRPQKGVLALLCNDIGNEISKVCYNNNLSLEALLPNGLLPLKEIDTLSSIHEIKFFVFECFACMFNKCKEDFVVKNPIILSAIKYINSNYYKQLSLNDFADIFGCNQNYFSNLFKKEVGRGFVEYLNALRIQKALELAKQGRYKAGEIAELVGYNNIAYFSRVFKEVTGKTFSEARQGN